MSTSTEQSLARTETLKLILPVGSTENSLPPLIQGNAKKISAASDTQLAILLQAVSQGEKSALSALYDLISNQVFKLALQILKDVSRANEITLAVFMEIWDKGGEHRLYEGAPLCWILTIARNRALDQLRTSNVSACETDLSTARFQKDVVLAKNDETERLFSEKRSRVQAALNKLGVNERQLLEAAYYEGLSESELAVKFHLSSSLVRSLIGSAMLSLKKDLLINYSSN